MNFTLNEVKRDIMPTYGGSLRFIERAGQQFERALACAQRVAEPAPLAAQATIANARLAPGQGWMHAPAHATAMNTFLYGTEDAAEARKSFAEKRTAKFVGR